MRLRVLLASLNLLLCGGALGQSANPGGNAYFAVNASSQVDIVTQVNALVATCGANCVIHIPAGKYVTHSSVPITLHGGQSLIGDGEHLTSITANVPKFIVWHAASDAEFYVPAGTISNMAIHCGAETVECIDTGDLVQAHFETLLVDNTPNGDCIGITNQTHWFERSSMINVTVGSPGPVSAQCGVGIHLRPSTGGTNSYGYAYWPSIYQNNASMGVFVDAGNILYNASFIGIQSNQGGGFALVTSGGVTASFLSITGEGSGGGIHVLKGGSVRGCGSQLSQLHADVVDGLADDTHTPIDLTDCGFSSAVTPFANYIGEGPASFTPRILNHSSTGEVNAGMFFSGNKDRTGGPAMLFTRGGHFSVGWKDLYNPIGIYYPVWSIDASGNATETGALTAANIKSGENVVAYSAAPVFSAAAQTNLVTLGGNLGGFTLAAGAPGQAMTLIFCQSARGGATVVAPANVRGLGAVGTVPGRCSAQSFVYSANQAAWMASGAMVVNE
jgi:hypothetical protein